MLGFDFNGLKVANHPALWFNLQILTLSSYKSISGDGEKIIILIIYGEGGQIDPCDAKLSKMCPYSHQDNDDVIIQISLLDTILYYTIYAYKIDLKIIKISNLDKLYFFFYKN